MSIFSLREPRNTWEMCLWSCLWGVTFMTLIDVEDLCLLCMGPVSGLGNLDSPGRHRMLHGGMHSLLQNLHCVGDGTGYFKPLLPCCLCPIDLQFQAETNPLSLQLLLLNILPQHQEKKPRGKHLLQGMQAPAPGYASTRPRACFSLQIQILYSSSICSTHSLSSWFLLGRICLLGDLVIACTFPVHYYVIVHSSILSFLQNLNQNSNSNIHFFIHYVSESNLFSVHLAKAAADTKIRPFYASKCCSTKLYPCSVSIYLFTYFSLFMGQFVCLF